jgi:hypothetical protein
VIVVLAIPLTVVACEVAMMLAVKAAVSPGEDKSVVV